MKQSFVSLILRRTCLLGATALLLSWGSALAQTPREENRPPLSLEECIRLAHQQSLVMQQAQIEQTTQSIAAERARNQYLPQISASIGQSIDLGRSADKNGIMQDRSSTATGMGVSASMELFSGLRRPAQVRAAELNLQAATLRLQKAQQEISLAVAQYFYNLLYQQELERVARQQVSLTGQLINKAQAMVGSGKWSQAQLSELETQWAHEKLNLKETENKTQLARFDLMQLLNLPANHPPLSIEAPNVTDMLLSARGKLTAQTDASEKAVALHPAIRAAALQTESARQEINIARSGYMPSVTLSAGYNNSYFYQLDKEYRLLNIPFGDQLKNNGRYSVSLSVSIPIFSRFETRNAVRSAQQRVLLSQLDEQQAQRTISREIRLALLNAQAAESKIEVAQTAVKQASEALQFAQSGMEAGRISTYDFAQAKSKLYTAQVEELQALYDFIYKSLVLDFYTTQP